MVKYTHIVCCAVISVLLGRNPGPIARGREIEALAFPAVPGALPAGASGCAVF